MQFPDVDLDIPYATYPPTFEDLQARISDVGLFTDKTEVTMRHRPTEELEQLLRERLMKTIEQMPESPIPALDVQDAPISDAK